MLVCVGLLPICHILHMYVIHTFSDPLHVYTKQLNFSSLKRQLPHKT